jgi:predicted ATPase
MEAARKRSDGDANEVATSASACHVTVNRQSFTLIAGANGSGKSTLTNSNPDTFAFFPVLDPDAITRTIQSTNTASSAITAGRQALQIAKQLLHDQKSFAVETTLSDKNYLQMMLDARNLGFEVVLVYIGTETVEINLARIINRVLMNSARCFVTAGIPRGKRFRFTCWICRLGIYLQSSLPSSRAENLRSERKGRRHWLFLRDYRLYLKPGPE